MKRSFLTSVLLTAILYTWAGEIKYPVGALPEKLTKDAHAVKRTDEQEWIIYGPGEMKMHRKVAVTILDEAGDDYADVSVSYDKFREIKYLEGNLYDAQGNLLKHVKTKDIRDESADESGTFVNDDRVKFHRFAWKSYPYTVEYEWEMKFTSAMYLPHLWIPQNASSLAVESSKITISTPADYLIHFRQFNYKRDPVIVTEKNTKSYTWQCSAMVPFKSEANAPTWNELTTSVYFAPSDFVIDGYKGNMDSWNAFGKFIFSLNKERDQLPDNVKATVKELTEGVTDAREKVRRLYEFMQAHTRYINIALGIGGLQPFSAGDVAKNGYGDCKALSNYMYSLLKEAGIRSLYTLVSAGRNKEDKYMVSDFPSDYFDHIILCVPMQKDSMWLECTSQDLPAGYMSDFTGNRMALAIDENGGTLVATPRYGLNENLQTRTLKGQLKDDGTLAAIVATDYKAVQEDYLHGMVNGLSPEKVKKHLNEQFELATYDINSFRYQETKSSLPVLNEQLELSISNYATVTGKRLFIMPNVLNRSTDRLDDEERHFDFVFSGEWRDIDSVDIEIPKGYKPEAVPADVSLRTKYGSYQSSTKIKDGHIIYYRLREQYVGRFPVTDKEAIASFYATIYKSDRSKIVLMKEDQ